MGGNITHQFPFTIHTVYFFPVSLCKLNPTPYLWELLNKQIGPVYF